MKTPILRVPSSLYIEQIVEEFRACGRTEGELKEISAFCFFAIRTETVIDPSRADEIFRLAEKACPLTK